MDFLRQHLPGLHQALRGALESFSTFVSYLLGDAVPTVQKEAQAAEELGEVAVGRPGQTVEEEALEAQQGLSGSHSKEDGELRGPEEATSQQEGGSAAEQAWGWGGDSSHRVRAGRQDTGDRGVPEASASLKVKRKSEAESGAHGDRSSQVQESQEPREQEVSRGDTQRTWEQEEEEEVRAEEPETARGVESEWPWRGLSRGNRQNVAGDQEETGQAVREAGVETEAAGDGGARREEEVAEGTGIQGTQGPGAESEDWAASGREGADLLAVGETEDELVPAEGISEAARGIKVLEETPTTDQAEEAGEKRDTEAALSLKQPWALGTEGQEEVAEGQTAGRAAAGGQDPEKEAGESFEDGDGQYEKDAEGKQGPESRADGAHVQEEAKDAQEERGSYGATEAELAPDKEVGSDLEARPEEGLMRERNGEAQVSQDPQGGEWSGLELTVPETRQPELVACGQSSAEEPEERQGNEEKLRGDSGLGSEEAEREREEQPRRTGSVAPELPEAEAWESQRRDVESKDTQRDRAGAERGKEEAAGKAQAAGGRESELPEEEASAAERQVLQESPGAEAEVGQSLRESEARGTKDREVEAVLPWGPGRGGWKLEEAPPRVHHGKDTQASSLAAETVDKAVLDVRSPRVADKPKQEVTGTWEEVAASGGHAEAYEAREEEQAGMRGSAVAEDGGRVDGDTAGSQAAGAEGALSTAEAKGLQREQCGDQHPKGEAQRPPDVNDTKVTGGRRTEAQETDLEGPEDAQGQEGQLIHQAPAETAPWPSEIAETVGSDKGDTQSSWSEALLPGSRLDVSVPRSRVLLSRSSSQRRSRPSFRRTPAPEQQEDPSSPQPEEEELSALQQEPLQLEDTPEPTPPRPGGTPVPTRRKPLGHGFGFAHVGMMQELQARLGQPKPQ
ncbi:apolipoprotein B receptor [Ctenodactylus gundi]